MLVMPEEATRVAALRSAKIDLLAAFLGWSALSSMDQVDSLRKTNPRTGAGAVFISVVDVLDC